MDMSKVVGTDGPDSLCGWLVLVSRSQTSPQPLWQLSLRLMHKELQFSARSSRMWVGGLKVEMAGGGRLKVADGEAACDSTTTTNTNGESGRNNCQSNQTQNLDIVCWMVISGLKWAIL